MFDSMTSRHPFFLPLGAPTLFLVLASLTAPAFASPQNLTGRVSVSTTGEQANAGSYYATISADGRYVSFASDASNLVLGDTNGVTDVFRHDRLTGATVRVSVSSSGAEGDDESYTSYLTAISADGRYVVFTSDASNLVPGDTNGTEDVFVRDVVAGTTIRVSVGPGDLEADGVSYDASISADGSRVVFTSDATNLVSPSPAVPGQVYVHDWTTGQTSIASVDSSGIPADGQSSYPAISGDGNVVAFLSHAYNLTSGIPASVIPYAFYVHDLTTGSTAIGVSPASVLDGSHFAGYQSLSHDGRLAAFWSDAPDLVQGDTNGAGDAFVLDVATGGIRRVSVSSTGEQGDALIAFPRISPDGRFVAFSSDAASFVPGDTNGKFDAFVNDLQTGATTRISVGSNGEQGTLPSSLSGGAFPDGLSADGRYVAFIAEYRNLVPGDSNGVADVFVQDRASPVPTRYCEATLDSRGCLPRIESSGTASSTGAAAFDVRADPVRGQRLGVLLYGLGPNHEALGGGTLCLAPPLRRAAILGSGGSSSTSCTGAFSYDFNARIRSGVDPDLAPGTVVYVQFLYRDGQDPTGPRLGMSDALRFAIQP